MNARRQSRPTTSPEHQALLEEIAKHLGLFNRDGNPNTSAALRQVLKILDQPLRIWAQSSDKENRILLAQILASESTNPEGEALSPVPLAPPKPNESVDWQEIF